jgi:MFS family permease
MTDRLPAEFRRLLAARTLSVFGDLVLPVAVSFAVLDTLHGGPAAVGVAMGAEFAGMLAFLLVGGVLADRLSPVTTMVAADIGRMLLQFVTALMLATGTMSVPLLAGLMVLRGVGTAFFSPAFGPLMLDLVGPERIQRAGGQLNSTISFAVIGGPLVAGGLVVWIGPAGAIAVDGLSFLASAVLLAGVRRGAQRPGARAKAESSMARELRSGAREVLSRPWLWGSIAVALVVDLFAAGPYTTVLPVVADQHYGGAAGYSWLLAGLGAGSLVGGLVAGRLPVVRHTLVANLMLTPMALSSLALALHAELWIVLVTMVVCGASQTAFGVLWGALLGRGVPRAMRGRVSSWDTLGSLALRPVGQSMGGVVAGRDGIGVVLWVATVVLVLAPLSMVSSRHGRRSTADIEREAAVAQEADQTASVVSTAMSAQTSAGE